MTVLSPSSAHPFIPVALDYITMPHTSHMSAPRSLSPSLSKCHTSRINVPRRGLSFSISTLSGPQAFPRMFVQLPTMGPSRCAAQRILRAIQGHSKSRADSQLDYVSEILDKGYP